MARHSERATQDRIIRLFQEELDYRYLGDWRDRPGNSNIDNKMLKGHLLRRGYTDDQITRAIYALRSEADNPSRGLYENNKAVYEFLRYGVQVKTEAGKEAETVHFIEWDDPDKNDFAIAEEVTLQRARERRPDIVLYVNGIALGVLELKSSRVSIADGIRQNLSNQQPDFNEWFFSTIQFVFAGNDSEGLKYGTICTPEKYFLTWKEDESDNTRFKVDKYLLKMCEKGRLLELIYDFVVFDAGVKKLPRVHQYFGVKAAQKRVSEGRGGIIWHTQGSGKSLVMVLLARWILENVTHGRVAVITDRDELDKQIKDNFTDMGETIYRTSSGRDLMRQLGQAAPRLLCSLVHKFGKRDVDDFDAYVRELETEPSLTVGEVFVFVDECHRTQSGRLHRAMKAVMPNAVFIGFTGTPLLKRDKQTSLEVFGSYIHTYKFSEGVEDGVVLDLIYEARDIDQRISSPDKIDAWFDAKTRGLNDWQKDELKKQWATMQKVLSSSSRMNKVVGDIVTDFGIQPRLSSQRGNAILVAASIRDACAYYSLFQSTPLQGKCGLVTSYNPQTQDITTEETGANTQTDKQFIFDTYAELLKDVEPNPGQTRTETYEDEAKRKFVKEPASMKLMIVVDKLLTGFSAQPCTYMYIDKTMRDHGLFQAICRVNRLDTEDKDYGHIVDYKELLESVKNSLAVYTSELDDSADGPPPDVLLKDRLKIGRENLDSSLEKLALLCEPVEPPKGVLEYIHYFCGNTEVVEDLEEREPLRSELYRQTVSLIRAYANISNDLEPAGFGDDEIVAIKRKVREYTDIRDTVRRASGEILDFKPYEAEMRHLLDTYVEAAGPRSISSFDDMGLVDLIVKTGIASALRSQPERLRSDRNAMAETIENNVRSRILKSQLSDPAYFAKMSALLHEIIADRKAKALEYEKYLDRIAELARDVAVGQWADNPTTLDTPGKRALYNNLGEDEALALRIDAEVRRVKPDDFRGVLAKENVVKSALYEILQDKEKVNAVFAIIKEQTEY